MTHIYRRITFTNVIEFMTMKTFLMTLFFVFPVFPTILKINLSYEYIKCYFDTGGEPMNLFKIC